MLNVHPALLERLSGQLPAGAKFISALSDNSETSSFVIEIDGKQSRIDMPKVPFNDKGLSLQISARQGEVLEDVIDRVSEKYGLCLVKQVDYWNKNPVNFESTDSITVKVPLLLDAIFYNGSFVIRITNDDKDFVRDIDPSKVSYIHQQTSLALCSKIFVRDAPSFTGNNLNVNFVKDIQKYLKSVGINLTKKQTDLWLVGEVVQVINDGVSDIVLVHTDGVVYSLRAKLTEDDAPLQRIK